MVRLLLFLLFISLQISTVAQSYTSWITGDTADANVLAPLPGAVLAGGGGDNDEAMAWMLARADGGDVLVLRASNSDGYNNYFFSQLGVVVNSVETIRFDGPEASSDPYVIRRIREAEVVFMAGGDQFDYYEFWKDNEIEEALRYLIHEKAITLGGTSAGMAVLGHYYYAPSSLGVVASEALSDPYHPFMDVLGGEDFLDVPYLEHTITDTHFDQRERAGRTMTFLARMVQDFGIRAKGIAANEYTAVAIDENGIARAFGEYPEFEEDQIYFMQALCESPLEPEQCVAGQPLDWQKGGQAVKVLRIPATLDGSGFIDLKDWETQEGGEWEHWYVENGQLVQEPNGTKPDCADFVSTEDPIFAPSYTVSPNPFQEGFWLERNERINETWQVELVNSLGVQVAVHRLDYGQTDIYWNTSTLARGFYTLILRNQNGQTDIRKLVKH